ncbi:hypothetical protein OESDEN_00494 [Oesophagostomum dentatum]|uniref:Uncharacterized protein n=1 Tax=Oesophagostomum dentatum TaxID=61180 RepID=A0A0B1TPP1_OESDE|nr:hypothetical protein OESDEN_00494 [Oesophagostomum dentatum]
MGGAIECRAIEFTKPFQKQSVPWMISFPLLMLLVSYPDIEPSSNMLPRAHEPVNLEINSIIADHWERPLEQEFCTLKNDVESRTNNCQ